MGSRARPPRRALPDRVGPARARRHAEDVRPAHERPRGPLVRGSTAPGQEPALPHGRRGARAPGTPDERGPPAIPAGRQGRPQEAHVPRGVRGRKRAPPDRGRQEEAGGGVAPHPASLEAELAHLGPDALDLDAAGLGRFSRASAVSSIPSSATSARLQASAAPMRTRSSGRRGSPPSGSRPTSRKARSRRWRPRSGTTSNERSSSASPARATPTSTRCTAGSGKRARAAARRSGASTSRSTRSRTAPPARPGDGS